MADTSAAEERCEGCGGRLTPSQRASGKTRCNRCRGVEKQTAEITPGEQATLPAVRPTGLCAHCSEETPNLFPQFVKERGRAYWLCCGCAGYAFLRGSLPMLGDDAAELPAGFWGSP